MPGIADIYPSFRHIYGMARNCCRKSAKLEKELLTIESKYQLTPAGAAAELGRIFRNHVVHGDDPVPPEIDYWPTYRFYAVSKLLLVLIQMLALRALNEPDMVISLSPVWDEEQERADWLFTRLHLKEDLWVGKDTRTANSPRCPDPAGMDAKS